MAIEEFTAREYMCDKCGKVVTVHIRYASQPPKSHPSGWCIVKFEENWRCTWEQEMHFCSPEHYLEYITTHL